MTEVELDDLLDRMQDQTLCAVSSDSISWKALREAEALDDEGLMAPLLARMSAAKKARRDRVYTALSHLGRNTGNPAIAEALIGQLGKETDKYVLHYLLQGIGRQPMIPHVERIVSYLEDPRWLVRHAAIGALGRCAGGIAEGALIDVLRHHADPDDLIYALASLNNMGTARSVPDIVPLVAHAKAEVRAVALNTLASIGGPDLTPVYIQGLEDRVATVKCYAIFAIRRRADERAVESVRHRVKHLALHRPKTVLHGETELVTGLHYLERYRASNASVQALFDWIATVKWPVLSDVEKGYLRRDLPFFAECPAPEAPVELPRRAAWLEAGDGPGAGDR
ncbi:MAG TPA: HEAT repeat domain-containing protein [Armatimonadota bacterium]|jgi:HEAT repeat protein